MVRKEESEPIDRFGYHRWPLCENLGSLLSNPSEILRYFQKQVCFFFRKKKTKICFGSNAKSRWDLHAAIPNFHSMATDGIRFDLSDQIPPFAPFLPSYFADLEVMKWTFWTKIILTL